MIAMIRPLLLLAWLLVRESVQYPAGAPDSACTSMVPEHGLSTPQASASPYAVYVSAGQYSAGGNLTVTINGSQPFKGFMLMASTPAMTVPVGSFATSPDTQQVCSDGALTHTSSSTKSSLTAVWTAPASVQGNLYFYATVVQQKDIFWISVPSALVWDGQASTASTTAANIVNSQSVLPLSSVTACGVTQSCITSPSGCTGTNCLYLLTWQLLPGLTTVNAAVQFTVQTPTSSAIGYIAIGFSKAYNMNAISVVNCVATNTGARVTQSYSSRNQEPAAITASSNLLNATASTSSGLLQCSFVWKNAAAARQSAQQFDLTSDYYVILARGPAVGNAAGNILQHRSSPVSSANTIVVASSKYTNYLPAGGSSSVWLKKVHGAFMTVAWLLCCTTSVILARYYKKNWLDTKLCGEKIWFAWHRALALACAGLTLIAFVLVFIAVQDWSSNGSLPYDSHAYLGVIVTALVIANPIMGFFRPNPGAKMRRVFNWAHWAVGNLALILAGTNLLTGFELNTSVCPIWLQYLAAAYVVWFGIGYFGLMLEQYLSSRSSELPQDNMEMESIDNRRTSPSQGISKDYLRRVLLAVHLFITILVTAVLFIAILASS